MRMRYEARMTQSHAGNHIQAPVQLSSDVCKVVQRCRASSHSRADGE